MSDRLSAARDYVAKRPTDKFGLYTFAMELRKIKSWEECFATFDSLLVHHPGNGPGYYHYGMARKESGDRPGAKSVWARGLTACEGTDRKTAAELAEALESIDD